MVWRSAMPTWVMLEVATAPSPTTWMASPLWCVRYLLSIGCVWIVGMMLDREKSRAVADSG